LAERSGGRIEEALQTPRFEATADLESTLCRYAALYNQPISQGGWAVSPPVQTLKNGRTSHSHLFRKKVYKEVGLDASYGSYQRW
jgi:hypothetical protein